MAGLMTEEIAHKEFPGIPLAVLRQNLIKILKEYGVTDKTTYELADEMSPYFYLLDEKQGSFPKRGVRKWNIGSTVSVITSRKYLSRMS